MKKSELRRIIREVISEQREPSISPGLLSKLEAMTSKFTPEEWEEATSKNHWWIPVLAYLYKKKKDHDDAHADGPSDTQGW